MKKLLFIIAFMTIGITQSNAQMLKFGVKAGANFASLEGDGLEGLETYTIKGGLYAVFLHQGPASTFYVTFSKIFTDWLPKSDYEVDDREHFELLGKKYSNTNPDSEEEIWIPIKLKK